MLSFSFSYSLALLSLLTSTAYAADADEWRSRSIYQILTDRFAVSKDQDPKPCEPEMGIHCGGSWKGITEHLDYIQGMNFDAIWISPIVAQMPNWTGDGEAYGGYWQQNLYELNEAFGSEEDLQELVTEVHKRGMLLMLDIVVNHMVGPKQENGEFDYSLMRPFNDEKYFHEYCPSGYTDEDLDNLQNCWLGSLEAPLADLKTESQEVKDMLGLWIKNQVWKYGIDGLRIDAAINVPKEFFPEFMEHAGVFATSEVYTQQEDLACQWTPGIPSILNYPLYWPMSAAFEGPDGNFETLKGMVESIGEQCHDYTLLGTFAENHDVARFRNRTEDIVRAENIGAYVLLSDGIPVIMYGQEQHLAGDVEPFYNRAALWEIGFDEDATLYKLFAKLNLFRRFMGRQYPKYLTNLSKSIKIESNTMTWVKGGDNGPNAISVFNNKGGDADDFAVELCDGHGYSSGDELMDIVSCKSVEVGGNGCIEAWVSDGHPVVLFKKSALEGSGLCDFSDDEVAVESKAVISTTWTSFVDGRATVIHSATTMPWADAPSSITATSTAAAASSTSDSESSGGVSAPRPELISSLSLALIPALILSASMAISLDRFLR